MFAALFLLALQDPGVTLTPPATVTLERAERTVGEILKAVRDQTKLKIDASQLDETRKVTIGWKNAPVLQTLDELCRALGAGQVRSSKEDISIDGSAALPKAVGHGDRFRFEVDNVHVAITRRMSGTTRNVTVSLRFEAQPGVDISQATPQMRLEEALDDRGWSLMGAESQHDGGGMVPLEDKEEPDVVEFDRHRGMAGGRGGGRLSVGVQAPALDAKAIEVIRCRAALTFPMRSVEGEVPVAELVEGKEFQIGSMTVKVKKFEQKGAEATLDVSTKGVRDDRGGMFPHFSLVDADGKTVSQGSSGSGGGDGFKWQYKLGSDAPVAALQYKATAGRITKVVRFEIRNIPLPVKE
ncbi:MAG TPA: hypothetical protein VFS19_06655 [Planctomycetota bacterium]|nr:hypothetical protein [Planctomycetota bacterium]